MDLLERWSAPLRNEGQRRAFCEWLRGHDIDPQDVWEVDLVVTESRAPAIVVRSWARDEQGNRYIANPDAPRDDHVVAIAPDELVPLRSWPPTDAGYLLSN